MRSKNTFGKSNAYLLLTLCILCFISGIAILAIGALHHLNPQFTLASLFKIESFKHIVFSLIPGIR